MAAAHCVAIQRPPMTIAKTTNAWPNRTLVGVTRHLRHDTNPTAKGPDSRAMIRIESDETQRPCSTQEPTSADTKRRYSQSWEGRRADDAGTEHDSAGRMHR